MSHPLHARPGKLIVLEGPDGSGKTTLAAGLKVLFEDAGQPVRLLREPGGTDISEQIRSMVKDPASVIAPRAEALLFAAARAQLTEEVIRPALEMGDWVLLDRWIPSSVIYQGRGRGLGEEPVRELSRFATEDLQPDVLLVMDLPEEVAHQRQTARDLTQSDRFERDTSEFRRHVAIGYQELTWHPDATVIDASQSPQDMLSDAWDVLSGVLCDQWDAQRA